MKTIRDYLYVAPHIERALQAGLPVVALESTIIAHGMPYPKNVETALKVEATIRENGAIPATIALIDGKIVVGLEAEEIERIGKAGLSVIKASRRDLPIVLATKALGATTVAATMIAAHLAGIPIFATGGIGGVHRGGERSMDVSADLDELAATPVMVVCSGAKSILDLGLTLEYLETKGVPVIGYQTAELPAFYTRISGHKLANHLDDVRTIAAVYQAKQALGLKNGMVIANPIPEDMAMDEAMISETIKNALAAADEDGIHGKEITPYLLDKVQRMTGGASLEANIALVLNNAKVASQIAVQLSELNRPRAVL